MLPGVAAQFSSDGVVIRYVLPVLQITSCVHTMGPIGGRMGMAFCSPVSTGRVQAAVGRLAW